MNLTSKEKGKQTRELILQAIINYIKENGYPPTVRELMDITGRSLSCVHTQLQIMERMNMIKLGEYGSPRAISVPGYYFLNDEEIKEYFNALTTKERTP